MTENILHQFHINFLFVLHQLQRFSVRLKNLNNDNKCQKIENGKFCKKKNAKIRDVEIMKNIPLQLKLYSHLLLNPRGVSSAPEAGEKNNLKNKFFFVTYNQSPMDVFWPLRLEKREEWKMSKKT